MQLTVTRTGDTSEAASIDFDVTGGTATANSDFTDVGGTLSFAAGETSKTFNVAINNDTVDEPNETIQFGLSDPTGEGAAIRVDGCRGSHAASARAR